MNKQDLISKFCNGNTKLKGSHLFTTYNVENDLNLLYNYSTVIAVYDYNTGIVYLNNSHYSMTTTRNQNLIRYYSNKIEEHTSEELYAQLKELGVL